MSDSTKIYIMIGSSRLMNQIYPEPTVGALIINNMDEILLVKSHKWKNKKYSVPGGHVELGESFEEAVIREVKEETGLDVVPKRLFMIQECVYPKEFIKKKHFIFFDYICKTNDGSVSLDNKELQEYVWIKIQDINEESLESYTRNMILKFKEDRDLDSEKVYLIKK